MSHEVLPCITRNAVRTEALSARRRDEPAKVDTQTDDLHRTRVILAGLVKAYEIQV
jgi:hypothetical protein